MKLLLLALLLLPAAPAAAKETKRETLLKRFTDSCENVVAENHDNPEEICRCITRNIRAAYNDKELELMTKAHEEDPAAQAELQEDKNSRLVDIDYDVTEGCIENPAFQYEK